MTTKSALVCVGTTIALALLATWIATGSARIGGNAVSAPPAAASGAGVSAGSAGQAADRVPTRPHVVLGGRLAPVGARARRAAPASAVSAARARSAAPATASGGTALDPGTAIPPLEARQDPAQRGIPLIDAGAARDRRGWSQA